MCQFFRESYSHETKFILLLLGILSIQNVCVASFDSEEAHAALECTALNPTTEMETGFKNFINALNLLFDLHPVAELTLYSQFEAISQKLSIAQTIKWRRESDVGGQWRVAGVTGSEILNHDRVIFRIERIEKPTKDFSVYQQDEHAYVE